MATTHEARQAALDRSRKAHEAATPDRPQDVDHPNALAVQAQALRALANGLVYVGDCILEAHSGVTYPEPPAPSGSVVIQRDSIPLLLELVNFEHETAEEGVRDVEVNMPGDTDALVEARERADQARMLRLELMRALS